MEVGESWLKKKTLVDPEAHIFLSSDRGKISPRLSPRSNPNPRQSDGDRPA